jgi:hypothetical protein
MDVVVTDDNGSDVGGVPKVPVRSRSLLLDILRASEFLKKLKNPELLPLTRQIAPLLTRRKRIRNMIRE